MKAGYVRQQGTCFLLVFLKWCCSTIDSRGKLHLLLKRQPLPEFSKHDPRGVNREGQQAVLFRPPYTLFARADAAVRYLDYMTAGYIPVRNTLTAGANISVITCVVPSGFYSKRGFVLRTNQV